MGHGRHICPQDPTLGVNHLFGTSKVIGDAQVLEPAGGGDVDRVGDGGAGGGGVGGGGAGGGGAGGGGAGGGGAP